MNSAKKKILIYEEEAEISPCLDVAVKSLGYYIHLARNVREVLSWLEDPEVEFSAVLLSVIPNQNGLNTLREIRAITIELPVILVAGLWPTRDVAAALKNGATDFLCKPVVREELASVLTSALKFRPPVAKSLPRDAGSPSIFMSANLRIKEIESRVRQIGWSGAPVLIQGETGSGKEVLARELHAQSARASKPFVKLNCAALPPELVESELFGYERGAFTGAFEKKVGMFELADGGTILLDEIGDMDIRLQAKLLQVLQDQEFRRIGGRETVKVNVRIMAATHRDLEKAIVDRSFREDLYYRLCVIVLHVPALRERSEDIVPLGRFLIRKHAEPGGPIPVVNADLADAMLTYHWPGNVRELENYMRNLVIFMDPDAIARDLRARIARKPPMSVRPTENQIVMMERRDDASILEQVTKDNRQAETAVILAALDSTRWNRKQAAAILKTEYKALLYKMKKLGIDEKPISLPKRLHMPSLRAAGG